MVAQVHQGKEKTERHRVESRKSGDRPAHPQDQEGDDYVRALAPQTPPRLGSTVDGVERKEGWEGTASTDASGGRVLEGSERRNLQVGSLPLRRDYLGMLSAQMVLFVKLVFTQEEQGGVILFCVRKFLVSNFNFLSSTP